MENAIHRVGPTHNNMAFIMQLTEGPVKKRLVYRFQQCMASICQHSSIGLTMHILANSMGKDESKKVLDDLAAKCLNGLNLKFYDIERIVQKLLPSIDIIMVSEFHLLEAPCLADCFKALVLSHASFMISVGGG